MLPLLCDAVYCNTSSGTKGALGHNIGFLVALQ